MKQTYWMATFACLVGGVTANAAFVTIPQPNASYTSSTTLIPITAVDLSTINSLSDPNLTINFSTGLQARTVPGTWSAPWNSPPAVENATPRVLDTPGTGTTLLTLTFSKALTTFGMEAQDDIFPPVALTANFFNGATNIGTISTTSALALLFAATTGGTPPITSVNITAATSDFAIANLRYALVPTTTPGVPEPATFLALAGGLLALGGYRKFRGSRA